MEDLYKYSETRMCKAIFPETLNANETLFGGKAMQWMDEIAYISATRFTRQRMFTVKTDPIKFLKAVPVNSFIEVVGKVVKAQAVKLEVKVAIFAEDMYSHERYKAVETSFTMAMLDKNRKPMRINYDKIPQREMAQELQ